MSTISLAMIVKNEEQLLGRCLSSYKDIVDEIIIVDTGSTDNTKEIAKKYTDKVYDFKWVDDFSLARNYSFSLCTKDYIMWTDADDIFPKNQVKEFLNLKTIIEYYDTIMMKYHITFDEKGKPTFSYFRERILKNDKTFVWEDAVHEVITPHGKILHSDLGIYHKPTLKEKQSDRNLLIYKKLIAEGKMLSARQKFYYTRELMHNGKTKDAIIHFEEYLQEPNLWKENAISACIDLSSCYLSQNDIENAQKSLLRSFTFDTPRAEALCELAYTFMTKSDYLSAIYWYELATKCTPKINSGAFVNISAYNITPYLQLCLCYYNIGDIEKSKYYNNLAGKVNKLHPSYIYNKQFFENLEQKNDIK